MPLSIHHSPARGNSRRVLLAIPSYGPISGHTAFSLFRCHPTLKEAGYEVEARFLIGDCHVDDARNSLVADFLESECDDLVFIDADIGFQDSDLIRLLSYERDIVGGAYPKKSDNPEFTGWLPDGPIWTDPEGLIEMKGMATGFLRIRRPVLDALASMAERYTTALGRVVPCIFERLIVGGLRYSGDVAFCYKARRAGFKVWADPDCYLEHRGEKSWIGTLGSHLKRMHGLSLTQEIERIKAGTETDKDYFDLTLQWSNDGWTAGAELLKAAVMVARQVKGVCLEAGSGLSTLAMAAANPSLTIHALEHNADWAARVRSSAQRLGLANIVIHECRLIEYPAGKWYELPRLPWGEVEMVLCDGPPRQEGNRRILFGVMATHDCRPKCILVDDAATEGDSIPAPYRTEIRGQLRQFAVGLRN